MPSTLNSAFIDNRESFASRQSRPVSRADTFRTFTEGFRADTFSRTITNTIGLTADSDEQWTRSLLGEYVEVQARGTDGDVPLPAGFAREARFWRMILIGGVLGCVMGILGLTFLNVTDKGHMYWIAIPTAAGFVCGLLRWMFRFPENMDGLFKEILFFHVEYQHAPLALLLSTISLSGGATLGPEQALATMGGGLATLLREYIDFDEDDRKLVVLVGMCGAIGALFPSPILTALMMFELGKPPRTFMEAVVILSFSASVGFSVYYQLLGYTWESPVNKELKLTYAWNYDSTNLLTGFVIGVISSGLCLLITIAMGVAKQVFTRIKTRLETVEQNCKLQKMNKLFSYVIPPTIGGLIIGLTNKALPLTVGNGNLVINKIVTYGLEHNLSNALLMQTGFARMLLLGVSLNCYGFVGGMVFPMLTISTIAGVVMWQQYTWLPQGLCIGCFFVGIPSGIIPMPFTLCLLCIFIFYFGTYQTAPLFISALTSYTLVCGSGLFKKMRQKAMAANAAAAGGPNVQHAEPSDNKSDMKEKEATLSLNKYLNSKDDLIGLHKEEGF